MRMNDPHANPAPRRRAVNVSVDPLLVAEAREYDIPLSATLEAALRQRIAEARRARWLEENEEAVAAFNARVEASGAFSDGLRRY